MTKAQQNLLDQVKSAYPNRFALRNANNQFKTADVLIEQGFIQNATVGSDFTRWVILR